MAGPKRERQAIVVVHGMGEQKPGQTVYPFSDMLRDQVPRLSPGTSGTPGKTPPEAYAGPTFVGKSYEGMRVHFPAQSGDAALVTADTDVFEYHWSYKMKDNRFRDLGGVAYRALVPASGPLHQVIVLVTLALALGLLAIVTGAWHIAPAPPWLLDVAGWMQTSSWRFVLSLPGSALEGLIGEPDSWLSSLQSCITEPVGAEACSTALGAMVAVVPLLLAIVTIASQWNSSASKPVDHARIARAERPTAWERSTPWVTAAIALAVLGWIALELRPYAWGGLWALCLFVAAIASLVLLVPHGLKVTWLIIWGLIAFLLARHLPAITRSLSDPGDAASVLVLLLGGGTVAFVAGQILGRVAPWLTASFVDVVRYVDTSPRSFEVRQDIRAGLVDLLDELHENDYGRIVVMAHSLGSYISYDAITSLWHHRAARHVPRDMELSPSSAEGWEAVHAWQASNLERMIGKEKEDNAEHPYWRISDFVTYGSPMYMADLLYTRTYEAFKALRDRNYFRISPPPPDARITVAGDAPITEKEKVLVDIAAFAAVRWTNLWYPTTLGFFGDPFGGRLSLLFGDGIHDLHLHDGWHARFPFLAHAFYTSRRKGAHRSAFADRAISIIWPRAAATGAEPAPPHMAGGASAR